MKDAFNIPNSLCYLRILLIPIFMYFFVTADQQNLSRYYISAIIILVSGITDMLDGFIARRFNMITELGKTLDPIADKLTQLAIAVAISIKFPAILVLVGIVFVKELVMGIFCLVLIRQKKKPDGAMWFGKISTWVYYVAMFTIVVIPKTPQNDVFVYLLAGTAGVFMLFAFILYLRFFKKIQKGEITN